MPDDPAEANSKTSRPIPAPLLAAEEWQSIIKIFKLSPQQARIVELILQGKKHKQIALELALSESTVQTYLGRLFTRLGIADRTELILHIFAAIRQGRDDKYMT